MYKGGEELATLAEALIIESPDWFAYGHLDLVPEELEHEPVTPQTLATHSVKLGRLILEKRDQFAESLGLSGNYKNDKEVEKNFMALIFSPKGKFEPKAEKIKIELLFILSLLHFCFTYLENKKHNIHLCFD